MTTQNSEFLLDLLLNENKHLNLVDFIDRQNQASTYSSICVSLGISQQFEPIRDVFTNAEVFVEKYFVIYATALDNYHSIVNNNLRQVYFDEANHIYKLQMNMITTDALITDQNNRNAAINLLENVKNNHSYAIFLRNEDAFIVIHYENDHFIVIDPHIEYCGILSKTGVYRYVVYDDIWNFNVHIIVPKIEIETIVDIPHQNVESKVDESI